MKKQLITAALLITILSPAVGFCYKELSQEELDEINSFPERFASQHLIIKDRVMGKFGRPIGRDYDAKIYASFTLAKSRLHCIIPKSQLMNLSLNIGSQPHVIVKGVMVMKRGPRLGSGKTHERYYFKVEELTEDSLEVKTGDWSKKDYKPVTFEALCLDMDAYVDKPVELSCKVSQGRPLTMLSSCDKHMGITADEYLLLIVGHAPGIRFLLPKNDDNLKKIKGVNFGDIKEKRMPVTFLLRGELKSCEGVVSDSGKQYAFIVHDLEST